MLAEKNSLSYNDRVNERTTCSFTLIEPNFIDIGMEVRILEDGIEVFAGSVENYTQYGDKVKYVSVSCVGFSQLIDKRVVFDTFTNQTAGFITRSLLTQFFSQEGITEGDIQDGALINKSVFNYDNGNVAMNYIQETTGMNWTIDGDKKLNLFERSTYIAPFGITDASTNYSGLKLKKNRDKYRNRQYVRAGKDVTKEIVKEKPTPKPDGVSRTFIVRLPIAQKPRLFIDDMEVLQSDIGINGLDDSKKYYFSFNSNVITQEQSEVALDAQKIEITYRGLYPILVVADNPGEIKNRKNLEGGSGIYEDVSQEENIDERESAFQYAYGKLDKFGLIPSVVEFNTYDKGLKAGQLLPVQSDKLGVDGNFLIESVTGRDDNGLTVFSVKCLDGATLGGWEKFFKSLVGASKKLVIRDNEVLLLLNSAFEKVGWVEQTSSAVYACSLPHVSLYPSEDLYPC